MSCRVVWILDQFEIVEHNKVRRFGQVERQSGVDWVKKCQQLIVDGKAGTGRGRKTWIDCVRRDMNELELRADDTKDREVWKRKILVKRPRRASMKNGH